MFASNRGEEHRIATVVEVLPDGSTGRLSPELIAAFQATLEETADAALLLHVVDCNAAEASDNIVEVHRVLERIGVRETPIIEVFNKIDLQESLEPHVERNASGQVTRVWVSASTGAGMHLLLESIAEWLNESKVHKRLLVPPEAGRLRAKLYSFGAVVDETILDNGGWALEVTLASARWQILLDRIAPEMREFNIAEPIDPAAPAVSQADPLAV